MPDEIRNRGIKARLADDGLQQFYGPQFPSTKHRWNRATPSQRAAYVQELDKEDEITLALFRDIRRTRWKEMVERLSNDAFRYEVAGLFTDLSLAKSGDRGWLVTQWLSQHKIEQVPTRPVGRPPGRKADESLFIAFAVWKAFLEDHWTMVEESRPPLQRDLPDWFVNVLRLRADEAALALRSGGRKACAIRLTAYRRDGTSDEDYVRRAVHRFAKSKPKAAAGILETVRSQLRA